MSYNQNGMNWPPLHVLWVLSPGYPVLLCLLPGQGNRKQIMPDNFSLSTPAVTILLPGG